MRALNQIIATTLVGFLAVSTSPKPAFAVTPTTDKERASVRFERGVELYQSGDVQAALIEFQRAYSLSPTYHLLFNIAQAAVELKDYVTAHQNFSQYLLEGGDEIDGERRNLVEAELERLQSYLAEIELEVSVGGAVIKIDGAQVGTSPANEAYLVSAGRRKIEVLKPGYAPWEQYIDIAGQEELVVQVELIALNPVGQSEADAAIAKPQSPVEVAASKPSRRIGPLFWTSATATMVFGAGTAVFAVLTQEAGRRYRNELDRVPNTHEAIADAAQEYRNMALATDIGLALAGSAALLTIGSAIWGGRARRAKGDARVGWSIQPRGVSLRARF